MGIVVSVAALVLYVPMSMVFVLGGKKLVPRAAGVAGSPSALYTFQPCIFLSSGTCVPACRYFLRVASPPRRCRSALFCSRTSRTFSYSSRSICRRRSDRSLCTVLLEMPKRLAAARTVALFSTIDLASSHARSSLFVCIMHHSPSGISSICAEGSSYGKYPRQKKNLPGATKMGSFECVRRCAGRAPANRNACSGGDARHNR